MVATDTCDEQVGQTVIVVIAHGHAHAIKAYVKPGAGRDLLEVSFAVIPVKRHCGWLLTRRNVRGPPGRVDEEQVLRAIVVEIQKRHTTAHGLRKQLVTISAAGVDKMDPGGGCYIREFHSWNLGCDSDRSR